MEHKEFKEILIPMQPAMQMLAERMLGDADEAADAVQAVYVSLWEKRRRLDGIENLKGYCMQSVRGRCIDVLRQRKFHLAMPEGVEEIDDSEVEEEVAANERRSARLSEALSTLPEKQRRAVEMKYFEKCTTEQMQQRLGMSSGNVYTTLSRALQTLKDKLKNI